MTPVFGGDSRWGNRRLGSMPSTDHTTVAISNYIGGFSAARPHRADAGALRSRWKRWRAAANSNGRRSAVSIVTMAGDSMSRRFTSQPH
jgi:hypothetical protein